MFSGSLLKQTIKANWGLWAVITGLMCLLCLQFAGMEMTRPLLFTIYYGMMTTILPGIYVLVTANKLVVSQVDRGSMAYVLSTPIKRGKVIATQALYMTLSLVAMFSLQTIAHLIMNQSSPISLETLGFFGLKGDLTAVMIVEINCSALMVSLALAAICFFVSCLFNTSKNYFSLAGAFIGVMILANMLAMFGSLGAGMEDLQNFKYLTLVSFYDFKSVILENKDWIEKMLVPAGLTLMAIFAGQGVFSKKDLPL